MSKKKRKRRTEILRIIIENDPKMLRIRTVKPEKGKGKKDRPRNNNWENEFLDNAA